MITLITVRRSTALEARSRILGCENCSEDAEIRFDWILDEVTGNRGSEVDYLLSEPLKCPRCFGEVAEKTLVEL